VSLRVQSGAGLPGRAGTPPTVERADDPTLWSKLGWYILLISIKTEAARPMSDTGFAKIFMHGRSQAVRLPLAFRLPGDRVRVRRVEGGILLEPMVTDIDAWFAELDRFADVPFMQDGRRQPPMPDPKDPFA
jgi:antitoxin VapB